MSDVTGYLLTLIGIYALGPLQFGYHIGELNTPQNVITCSSGAYDPMPSTLLNLPSCIPMDAVQYGTVVGVFPIGGLAGALVAGRIADRLGRRKACIYNSLFFVLGPVVMALAASTGALAFGRLLSGVSSGVAMVVVPIYLGEIAPPAARGSIGTVTQIACVVGILAANLLGLWLSSEPLWRLILLAGAFAGLAQAVLLLSTTESPKWVAAQTDNYAEAKRILQKLRERSDVEAEMKTWQSRDQDNDESVAGLLNDDDDRPISRRNRDYDNLTLLGLLRAPKYRRPILAAVIIQLANQATGVNAVIFYGVSVLSGLLPELSAWISVFIQVVNLVVTLLSARLIDHTGRRSLLLVSLLGMGLASLLLAVGLTHDVRILSALSAIGIVGAFGLGCGPIPFLLVGEFFDVEALGLAQSLSLAFNYVLTGCIGFFLYVPPSIACQRSQRRLLTCA